MNAILARSRSNFNTALEILMHHVILLNWVNLCLALVKSLKQSFLAAENVVTISDPEVGRGTAKSYDFFSY